MARVAVVDRDALDPRLVPRRHAVEQTHRAAMRDQRLDARMVEPGRIHRLALGAVGARSTVATRRMIANGVPRCIGSLVTAKPRSARRACHAASVRPVWRPKPWPRASLTKRSTHSLAMKPRRADASPMRSTSLPPIGRLV